MREKERVRDMVTNTNPRREKRKRVRACSGRPIGQFRSFFRCTPSIDKHMSCFLYIIFLIEGGRMGSGSGK